MAVVSIADCPKGTRDNIVTLLKVSGKKGLAKVHHWTSLLWHACRGLTLNLFTWAWTQNSSVPRRREVHVLQSTLSNHCYSETVTRRSKAIHLLHFQSYRSLGNDFGSLTVRSRTQLVVIRTFCKLQSWFRTYDKLSNTKAKLNWDSDVIGINQAPRVHDSI